MARYRMRALMAASSIGLLVGASAGAAYLGGRLARQADASSNAARLMQMAELNGEVTPSSALGVAPLNQTALGIATRFSPYGGMSGGVAEASATAPTLAAMRVSEDIRSQRSLLVRASETTPASPLKTTPLVASVRPAAAMVFKKASQNDSDCLAQAVYYEARGEGVDGMRAVAQVILNRVRHPAFPKSICGVVYQGANRRVSCQFSFTCNGAMGRPVEAYNWRRSREVASAALEGYVMKSVGTATHFHATYVAPGWSNTMVRVGTVGSHVFYQFRGRGSRIDNSLESVQTSEAPAVLVQASTTETVSTSDALNAAQVAPATPATVAPTGEARAQLVSAVNKADAAQGKAIQVKTVITGKSAQDIVAEVAQRPEGPAQ
jgi:hypothetical protein